MNKDEMAGLLDKQVGGLADYVNGFKACAKFVLDNWKEGNGTGPETNPGNPEGA
jgi:hypothetical protein